MKRVVLSAEMQSQLQARAELIDERGRLLGVFLPAGDYVREAVERANWDFDHEPLSEARRDVAERGVVSTSDMLAAVAKAAASYEASK